MKTFSKKRGHEASRVVKIACIFGDE